MSTESCVICDTDGPDDPCVVLARICLPEATGGRIGDKDISYDGRRVLYSVSALRTFAVCAAR